MKALVTGIAGFVGILCILQFLDSGDKSASLTNPNCHYKLNIKIVWPSQLRLNNFGLFHWVGIEAWTEKAAPFASEKLDRVIHFVAHAGLRCSSINLQPYLYADS